MDLREVVEFLKDTAGYIITIVVLLLIFTFVLAFQPVAGNSMSPTLEEGQVTLVSRFAYFFSFPKRNEIVIIKKDKKSYVKRIIGLPGENIKYLNGFLYIDDKPYKEDYLGNDITTSNFMFEDICDKKTCPSGVIPDDKYLVLGDNRMASEDSRSSSFGLVSKNEIKGKVIFKIFPLNQIGGVK